MRFFSQIQRLIFPPDATQPKTKNLLASYFVWMPCNLFEGPHVEARADDPVERFERVRPHSFNENVWKCLQTLGENITLLKQYPNSLHEKWVLNALTKLADAWAAKALKIIHPFNQAEWKQLITPTGAKKYIVFDDPFPPLPSRHGLANRVH